MARPTRRKARLIECGILPAKSFNLSSKICRLAGWHQILDGIHSILPPPSTRHPPSLFQTSLPLASFSHHVRNEFLPETLPDMPVSTTTDRNTSGFVYAATTVLTVRLAPRGVVSRNIPTRLFGTCGGSSRSTCLVSTPGPRRQAPSRTRHAGKCQRRLSRD